MRKRTMIAAVAAGVVGIGAVATPAVLAADDTDDSTRPYGESQQWRNGYGPGGDAGQGSGKGAGPGQGMGHGMGHGRMGAESDGDWQGRGMGPGNGMQQGQRFGEGAADGQGYGPGDCTNYQVMPDQPQGTLTEEQEQTLLGHAEEEKLAHDVYVALGEATDDPRFDRVAQSEARHLESVRSLLDRYGLEDPTEGLAEGEFADDEVAGTYRSYVATGSVSLEDALKVGQRIERADIEGLEESLEGLDAPDVENAYEHLLQASQQHLAAFSR